MDFALFLPFADTQTRIRAANRGITLIVDRFRVYQIELTIRRLRARRRNRRQNGRLPPVNRRVAGSSPARGAFHNQLTRAPSERSQYSAVGTEARERWSHSPRISERLYRVIVPQQRMNQPPRAALVRVAPRRPGCIGGLEYDAGVAGAPQALLRIRLETTSAATRRPAQLRPVDIADEHPTAPHGVERPHYRDDRRA